MNRRYASLLGISLAVLLMLVLTASLSAADKQSKLGNVQGRVAMLDNAGSSITVESKGVRRKVEYTSQTKFLYGHSHDSKPGSVDKLKENDYISCAGTYDNATTLNAKECVYREMK